MTTLPRLAWIATLLLAFGASGTSAVPLQFVLDPDSTIQFSGQTPQPLSGGFTIDCTPPPLVAVPGPCGTGTVDYDILSMRLSSPANLDETASGPDVAVLGPGGGFAASRSLVLSDVGTPSNAT